MDTQHIFAVVAQIVRSLDSRLSALEIRLDETTFKAYGLDSLMQIRLACQIEDHFDIDMTDSDAFAATSVQRLVRMIEAKLLMGAERRAS